MENILVSVIVPIYNVEKYLDRCIESIVTQDYKKLEIILVDDGSIDLSGQIADMWAEKDSRINVIHKKNGGLSSARNVGINVSKGEYLVFIDSDDWIHKHMISAMLMKVDKADIVCCGMLHASDNSIIKTDWFKKEHLFSSKEALDWLIDNTKMTSHIPRNLYKKELFNKICFPEGKIFEDLRTLHKLFMQAKNVCVIPDYYYYYYIRNDSITNVVKLRNRLEWFDALKEREEELEKFCVEYKDKIIMQRAVSISLAIVQNSYSREEKKIYEKKLKDIKLFLKQESTRKAVKQNATRAQYFYYKFACVFWFHANKAYYLLKRIICLKKKILKK